MQVILSHENADFDAIASMLAAHKLHPAASPILPRRVNRNVRSFLSLYWDVLPFVQLEELKRNARINRVILVDTQGIATLRGMSKKTEVWIVDHHLPAEDLNPEYRFEGDPIGATTTLLLERFPTQGIHLTPIEATLLLLGIYEDTGSLTYSATTARDVRAAAWLLEQRADLGLLVRFLHHPLNDEQRQLFSLLQDAAEVHQFDGQSVVVATAEVPGYADEISTLAHKLRDLYDPDALFVLVKLDRHIQMVARSTVDTIHVGRVAACFEGGGHARAAAAIVRDRSLAEARSELLSLLPDFVQPITTVAQIMSHGVETISSETTIDEANQRVLKVGHEGYPVVEGGRVVGLLTRRDIDRALQHKLGHAGVRRFMLPGEVTVTPSDPVTRLQTLMMEHGWGQVPVVSEKDGEVIGVVTRTDVINLWKPRIVGAEREEMRSRMERTIPEPVLQLVRQVGVVGQDLGVDLFLVAGVVRDILLDTPTMDLDMVVEGDAISLAKKVAGLFGGRVRTHTRFGTAKWIIDPAMWARFGELPGSGFVLPNAIDFVTARSEFYEHPTALPEVTRGSIKLDLHRRDFTINTLAVRLNPDRFGELLDFYGGKRDLERGLVRVLHSLSFIDDPTRILRAVRFEQRLGFRIEERTEELLHQSVNLLDRVSGDRIRHELELLLREPKPELGFARLSQLGVLAQIHPDLAFDSWVEERFVRVRNLLREPTWAPQVDAYLVELCYFGMLTFRLDQHSLEGLQRRLKVQHMTVESTRLLHALKRDFGQLAQAVLPSEVHRLLAPYPLSVLLMAAAAVGEEAVGNRIERYVHEWSPVRIHTTGHHLINRGIKPGPRYGELLRALLYARLDGQIVGDEQEDDFLEGLLAGHPNE
jgi:tRNA nucleotidyltransferase (CCA-adding enzyme)